ncbi:MAG: hypothetical protein HQL09_03855 [Nitrospirae bacterium]|nr:hypothetical protein [Nitrospirota bacterium]
MVMYKGGTLVGKGLYWSPIDGRRVDVQEDRRLPGDENAHYLRISPLGLIAIAPLFGMMYVVFLPLFGIGVFCISWVVPVIFTLASAASTGIRVCSRFDGRNAFFNSTPAGPSKKKSGATLGSRKQ